MAPRHFRSLSLVFATMIFPPLDAQPRPHRSPSRLTVLLDNYAGADAETLEAAAAVAREIYRRAGAQVDWIACAAPSHRPNNPGSCEAAPGPALIRARIMPTVRPGFTGIGSFVYGYAVPSTPGDFGWAATVFLDRVEQTAQKWKLEEATLLGCVIAHEVGHLLLGRNSHSSYGLMSADWKREEMQKIAEGSLVFVSSERREIQRRVLARLAAEP